jgi:hypothetical protein
LTATFAEAAELTPTADDDGLLVFISDYHHLIRWNASLGVWQFAPGDGGNGFFQDFAITPQTEGWALCDGSTVAYLVVGGATLSTSNITLPDLDGTAAYRKSAAAYTGSIVAAAGTSASESSHTHAGPSHDHTLPTTGLSEGTIEVQSGTGVEVASAASIHNFTSNSGAGGTGATGAGSAHSHGIGTLDPAHLNILPYFRQ